jgi:hypothetical protein
MKGKIECWFEIIGSLMFIVLSYVIIYKSPNFEQLKIIIPIICFCSGWIIHDRLNIISITNDN